MTRAQRITVQWYRRRRFKALVHLPSDPGLTDLQLAPMIGQPGGYFVDAGLQAMLLGKRTLMAEPPRRRRR